MFCVGKVEMVTAAGAGAAPTTPVKIASAARFLINFFPHADHRSKQSMLTPDENRAKVSQPEDPRGGRRRKPRLSTARKRA